MSSSSTYILLAFLVVPIYVAIQRHLRYLRLRRSIAKYGFRDRTSLRAMTMDQAGEIQRYLFELEFPDAFDRSLTYGFTQTLLFPASSALLVHTNQISSSFQSPKRFADTELLVSEFISFPPSSVRSRLAISRINYLHSRYASRISNDQMLYVLGVFACNPCNWIDKYEWRTLDQMEVVAMGTYWKGIGEMMGIDLEPIRGMARDSPQYDHDHYDAINWMLDMQRYLDEHDSHHLGYNSDIDALVKPTMDLGLTLVPKPLKGLALDAGLTLFDERYRKAGGLPTPSSLATALVHGFMTARKLLLRHIALPRPSFWSARTIPDAPDPATGRYHSAVYKTHPFYVTPTAWGRWGPGAWARWAVGGPLPGDQGDRFGPDGYKVEDVGPPAFVGKGAEWIEKDIARGEQVMPVGKCPFM